MFCDEVLELIEPIAAGELKPDDRVASHLASCSGCAAVLHEARRLEQMLQARVAPKPSAQFTARILGRIRRERWRREQFLDAGFNVAVGLVALAVVIALAMVLSGSGVAGISRDALDLLKSAAVDVARRIAPSLPLYAGAVGLVATALGVWWWAEKDLTL